MNQLPLADDVSFWSRQMFEHCVFLELLIGDPGIKAEARELAGQWDAVRQGADPTLPLERLIALKEHVLSRLARGEWLGWCLPSFCSHILYEARYFRARLGSGTTTGEDVATWIQVVRDHAEVGPKLVDPAAPPRLAESARVLSSVLGSLQKTCASQFHSGCLHEADKDFAAATAWVQAVPPGASVIPPMLADHIVRENERGRLVVRALMGAGA